MELLLGEKEAEKFVRTGEGHAALGNVGGGKALASAADAMRQKYPLQAPANARGDAMAFEDAVKCVSGTDDGAALRDCKQRGLSGEHALLLMAALSIGRLLHERNERTVSAFECGLQERWRDGVGESGPKS